MAIEPGYWPGAYPGMSSGEAYWLGTKKGEMGSPGRPRGPVKYWVGPKRGAGGKLMKLDMAPSAVM